VIDDLEQRGLVARNRHPAIACTCRTAHARGRDLLAQAQPVADEHDTELLAGFDETEQRPFVSLL
jgi:DNA-binding MarR family transcriptional regulator